MSTNASVVDLFCGVGGLTHGFVKERIPVVAGIDIDEDCRFPYEFNNNAPFINLDVAKAKSADISSLFHKGKAKVLVGCAPCQPFSTYNYRNDDPNWKLLNAFGRLIRDVKPDVVSMENVPQLVKFRHGRVFKNFLRVLDRCGYHISWDILFGPDYGLAQTRSRLVLLASRLGPIELPHPSHKYKHKTVRDVIGKLPPIASGEISASDPLHRSSKLSPTNLSRIKISAPGKTWRDWDKRLVTRCHKEDTGRGYSSVYGRMEWHKPSPTITTQFYGFGNGRFGHPEQNRALSLREGALLQSFPRNYRFARPGEAIHFKKIGRMVGNAVPVRLAQLIARSIKRHLTENGYA